MPIEWTDIDAYCRHGFPLAPWEVRIIEQLDDFWLTRPAADAGNPDAEFHPSATPGKHVTVSTRPMSSNLFDIVFGAKKRT